MASNRNEIRVGAVTAAASPAAVGARVPTGKRWNLNIIATNPTAGALTLTCAVLNKRHDYDQGRAITFTSTTQTGAALFGDIHPNGRWMAYSSGASTSFSVTQITAPGVIGSKEQVVAPGLGTLLTVKFSPDGNWIAVGGTTTPFLKVYSFSELYGVGLAVANPATLPNAGPVNGIAWHPAGTFIVISYGAAAQPVLSGWPWGPGFGAKLADSSTNGASNNAQDRTLHFRPQGDAVMCGNTNSPFISAFPFTNVFGARYANPSSLPGGRVVGLQWSPGGDALCYTNQSTAAVIAQLWSAGFSGTAFTLASMAAVANSGDVYAVDQYGFLAHEASSAVGGWWNPLGVAGATFQISAANGVTLAGCGFGTLLEGGVLVYGGNVSATIIFQSVVAAPAISGGIANICSALSIAAGATKQLPGYVMNEGERLIVSGSGALDVYVSAVEVTL